MTLFVSSKLNLFVALVVSVGLMAGGTFQTLSAGQKTESTSESRSSKKYVSL